MIKVVSVENMRKIEETADAQGITFDIMFDRVAIAVTGQILNHLAAVPNPRVAILVGSGNNGGDGLVTAVSLSQHDDINVSVYLATERPDDDAKLQAVRDAGIFIAEAKDDQQYRVLRNLVASAHIVVDALFGIGVRLPLKGDITKVLRNVQQAINTPPELPTEGIVIDTSGILEVGEWQRPRIIALDCPSGINCDTGEVDTHTLHADETITFIAIKQGLLMSPAAEYVGQLNVATLGIPEDLDILKDEPITLADSLTIRELLPMRDAFGHKGTFGKAMIIAGSVNYTGAAGLAALGAYRSGAGLVTVGAPLPVISGLASQLLETTWILLPQDMGVIGEKAAEVILKELKGYNALLIGPGLGQEDTTKEMLINLFTLIATPKPNKTRPIGFASLVNHEAKKTDEHEEKDEDEQLKSLPPLVLDADALNLLAKVENWWEKLPANTIITPHPGEMARLVGEETDVSHQNRVELAQQQAAKWKTIIVLKGAHTVIASPDGRTTILPFKTAALSTAGTGDVLSGMIIGLLAQGIEPYNAAVIAGYVHGSAGLMAAELNGSTHGVIAGDIVDLIGDILGELS